MHVITHSLPPLLSAFILTVMNSFMTKQICHFMEKIKRNRKQTWAEITSEDNRTPAAA